MDSRQVELQTLQHVVDHWFTQGGEQQFSALDQNPLSADALVANILDVVRREIALQVDETLAASDQNS